MVSGQGPVWAPRLRLPPAKIGKSKSGMLLGPALDPCSKEPRQTTGGASPNFANSTSSNASTYRSVKHSFNSSLPQKVVLKHTQHCSVIAVDRRFCTVSNGPEDDNKS
jgi:hypothetical protein